MTRDTCELVSVVGVALWLLVSVLALQVHSSGLGCRGGVASELH